MRKQILLVPVVLMLFVQCAGINDKKTADAPGRYLEVALAFNTENYPWLLGTKYPQMAVWVEADNRIPETVFVTRGAGKDKWLFADERPGALPVWSGIRPERVGPEIDAVTGATPGGDVHTIRWAVPEACAGKNLSVFIEANVSFDYNDFYSKDETSPGFSDVNGQPSVVWRAEFAAGTTPRQVSPEIIGHGHVLGKNSEIDPDMSGITTAAGLFDYIGISYQPGE